MSLPSVPWRPRFQIYGWLTGWCPDVLLLPIHLPCAYPDMKGRLRSLAASCALLMAPFPPQLQIPSSTTFKSPPLDGSLFLPELCDWHTKHSPDHELFVYAEEDGAVKHIKWSETGRAIHRGSQLIRERIGQSTNESTVVAIISSSGMSRSLSIYEYNLLTLHLSLSHCRFHSICNDCLEYHARKLCRLPDIHTQLCCGRCTSSR